MLLPCARGLFWNQSDKNIVSLHAQLKNKDNKQIENYVINSAPKISIPGNSNCNHFELIKFLKKNNYISNNHKHVWTNKKSLDKTKTILNSDFKNFFIQERIVIIEKILNLRFNSLVQILNT